jgi:hypothetical protein
MGADYWRFQLAEAHLKHEHSSIRALRGDSTG